MLRRISVMEIVFTFVSLKIKINLNNFSINFFFFVDCKLFQGICSVRIVEFLKCLVAA